MSEHDHCPRAAARGVGASRVWYCSRCDHPLARSTSRGIEVLPPLIPLPEKRDGLVAFGLAQARAVSGQQPEGHEGTVWGSIRRVPIYVYCPRPGVCGFGQHLH